MPASAQTPAQAPAPIRLALVLAGALVPLRSEGERPTPVGRDAPECAHVPGLAGLDQISRRHAELYWRSGHLCIRDTESANGTYVDGERITGPTRLWPGRHRLRLAEDVEVTVVELDEFGAPR
ncbi:FHA domain-containing protein [Streptomyces sp. NPDC057963]|uniref:FHA domain-containing protein n=1 Tax=Streptomyces sp. NPDC057963 TaxID=3346290 RepID=UPI0036EFFC4D